MRDRRHNRPNCGRQRLLYVSVSGPPRLFRRARLLSANGSFSNLSLEKNRMINVRPLYDRIVVKRIDEQETSRNGIVIPDSAKEKPQEGEDIAVGNGKRLEDGKLGAMDVKAGDRVLFGKSSGSETQMDGTEYIIMREDAI